LRRGACGQGGAGQGRNLIVFLDAFKAVGVPEGRRMARNRAWAARLTRLEDFA
jgi:hypothetical protein